jgi:hypothetical protein
MATLTVKTVTRTPEDFTADATAAAGGGDKFANDGFTFLMIKNGDASDHTVTATIQLAVDGQTPSGASHNITAGHTAILGPFPTSIYNDGSGFCNLTYSAVTSVTVLPVKCVGSG